MDRAFNNMVLRKMIKGKGIVFLAGKKAKNGSNNFYKGRIFPQKTFGSLKLRYCCNQWTSKISKQYSFLD